MGCCGITHDLSSDLINIPLNYNIKILEEIPPNSNNLKNKVYYIMQSFENIREQIVDFFDILIYKTGACCFTFPTIIHVLHSIWYKMSYDLNGKIENANIKYIEDSPYMELSFKNLKNSTISNIGLLFEYINNLRNLRMALKNLDSNIAELIYFIKENNEHNEMSKYEIQQAVNMFPELVSFYNTTLKRYKHEIFLFNVKRIDYCYRINLIGSEGFKQYEYIGDDVYKLIFLYKEISKKYPDELFYESLFNSEKIGKKFLEERINSKRQRKKDFKIKSIFDLDNNYENLKLLTE